MSERKEGWYWTRVSESSDWRPDKWTGEDWEDNIRSGYRGFIVQVGPRIPTPDEPWHEPTLERVRELCNGVNITQLKHIIDGMLEKEGL